MKVILYGCTVCGHKWIELDSDPNPHPVEQDFRTCEWKGCNSQRIWLSDVVEPSEILNTIEICSDWNEISI